MQAIVIDKPYRFVPPRFSRIWHWIVRRFLPRQLRQNFGITAVEWIGAEKLRASLESGHGVVLVSNHCRPCDPLVLDSLAAAVKRPFHVMASWHLFMMGKLKRFLLPRVGGFSVNREGMDRDSLKCAVKIVAEARFPLVIFAEGIITRCNDKLVNFMDGPEFVARAAAKQRPGNRVVVHPVFIRYFFEGDLQGTVTPVIESIEHRLSWQPQEHLTLHDRILKIGGALLSLKELEYFDSPQVGESPERLARLIERLLDPLETEWCSGRHDGGAMSRVKRLRAAILPAMVEGDLSVLERAGRWRQLADLYLVQQLYCYTGDYVKQPTPERILEMIERYEEDLTDFARPHAPIRAVIMVGDAIEVSAGRTASPDSFAMKLRAGMEEMLEVTKSFRRSHPTGVDP